LAESINISARFATTEKNLSGQSELSVLIKDCIAQSLSAQKKLYELYAPAAYGVIRRYMYNNEPAAQELLNDCFYKIFMKLEQYSFQGAFEGWIRRIVVNTVTDHLRKNIKDDQQHKEVHPEQVYIGSDSVEKLSHKELLKVIETLPDTQRLVFNLYVFENYSHKEIAKLLTINENNSRWHLNDARRRLKEKINYLMK
jgi:RNA polymerase sigma factor (sigma-70 family)